MKRTMLTTLMAVAMITAGGREAFAGPAPDSGVCDVPGATYPSIQSAVNDASCQTIQLEGNTTESVTIDRNLTISGVPTQGSAVVNGASGTPVFTILAGATVTFEDFQIAGGDATVAQGGGILNRGTLLLEATSVLISNATDGAGIYNAGTMTLIGGTQVYSNNATGNGGGIYNSGTLTLGPGSSVYSNIANNDGGGIFNAGTFFECVGSDVQGNEAPEGIDNDISGTPAEQCPTSPGPGGDGGDDDDDDLAGTGGPTDILVGAATLTLLAGALAHLATRRRTT